MDKEKLKKFFNTAKIVLLILFFASAFIVTTRQSKNIVKQKDPATINMLASGYCPGIISGGYDKPMTVLDDVKKEWETLARQYKAEGRKGFHKDWKIRYLETPQLGGAKYSWTLTRLMGGNAPEIMYSMSTPNFNDTSHKWYVDLSPYLAKPNPYIPGNKKWIDIFYPGAYNSWRSSKDKHIYCITIDQVEIGIFYNKDMFRECGIKDSELPPKTWAEFFDIQRRIKEKGKIPFLMTGVENMRLTWVANILTDMIYAGIFDQINVMNDPDIDSVNVDGQEKIRAIKKGIISVEDDRFFEVYRIIKEWSKYWQEGYLGTQNTLFFKKGKTAMTLDGSWFVRDLDADSMRDFDYGVFFLPALTKKTSKFGTGIAARGVGGTTAIQFSITKQSVQNKEALEATIDFLQFVSAPRNLSPMVKEAKTFLPAVKVKKEDWKDSPLMFMIPTLEKGRILYDGIHGLNSRCSDKWWATLQLYLEGKLDRKGITEEMNRAVDAAVDYQLDRYKDKWEWVKGDPIESDWEIKPYKSILDE